VLLLDNSAYARLGSPSLRPDRSEELAEQVRRRDIAVCLPFLLEAGYSARGAREHELLLADLTALPRLAITKEVEDTALRAQSELARIGHHRLPPVDLLVAAIAHEYRVGVLHYDADYDILATRTDLDFESVWLAARGSL
jgi:predicted nucleic acid-binding protein